MVVASDMDLEDVFYLKKLRLHSLPILLSSRNTLSEDFRGMAADNGFKESDRVAYAR